MGGVRKGALFGDFLKKSDNEAVIRLTDKSKSIQNFE